ncbi:TolC family protein [Deinococcus aquaedulcis]|uniref:TolC family protein n=1 Tax=Deinococcus aquaedulcis TaxID=2840455 RepID=UPI001F22EB13|nr:TolC family protein [Deinococcus aquaedulcis]
MPVPSPHSQAPLLALCAALLLSGAQAQSAPPPPPTSPPATTAPATTAPAGLNLPDLLLALRASPGWRGADLNYQAAVLALQSARTRAGLSVTAEADSSLSRVPWDGGEWKGAATVTLSASVAVLPWSPALAAVRSAERALIAAALDLRAARAAQTAALFQALGGLRRAQAGLEAAQAGRALAERLLTVTEAQRAGGLATEAGVLERRTALESAVAGQDTAARAVTQAAQALTRLLGTPVAVAPTVLTAPLPDLTPAGDLDTLLARALRQRPEVARAQAALADAQAGLSAARLDARLPDVTASVRAGQLADAQGNPGRTVGASLNLKAGVLGVQASVPLRDTGAAVSGVALSLNASLPLLGRPQDAALAQAELGTAQAELGLASARQAAELDVRTRFSALDDERAGLQAARTRVQAAELGVQNARARLQAGLGTALEQTQADLTLLQARQALQAAQDSVALAGLALAQATADLDPLLPTLPAPLPTGGQP